MDGTKLQYLKNKKGIMAVSTILILIVLAIVAGIIIYLVVKDGGILSKREIIRNEILHQIS